MMTRCYGENLILRSHAQRGVSKDEPHQYCCAPFETRSCGPLLRVRHFGI